MPCPGCEHSCSLLTIKVGAGHERHGLGPQSLWTAPCLPCLGLSDSQCPQIYSGLACLPHLAAGLHPPAPAPPTQPAQPEAPPPPATSLTRSQVAVHPVVLQPEASALLCSLLICLLPGLASLLLVNVLP